MRRGDIYLYEDENATDYIQAGERPVLIVQNNMGNEYSPTTIICPITSSAKKKLPTHCFIGRSGGLKYESIALCEQIRVINKSDLKGYIGTVTNPSTLKWLNRCLKNALGIEEYDNGYYR